MTAAIDAFYAFAPPERFAIDDGTIAVRSFGSGPAVVFVHGFPVHGATWRWLLPDLAARFRCLVVDLPGLGDGGWTRATDFTFTGQARRLARLAERLGLERFGIVAHDTGGTVARHTALLTPERVDRIALINTEIPGHRPPWIPLYQRTALLPGAAASFRLLLRSRRFLRSGMGFREFYSDRRLLDEPERLGPYLAPLLASQERMEGMPPLPRGARVGGRRRARAPPRRAEDAGAPPLGRGCHGTFPADLAEPMARQLGGPARFVRIPRASLMPHEERPDAVLEHLLSFLAGASDATRCRALTAALLRGPNPRRVR